MIKTALAFLIVALAVVLLAHDKHEDKLPPAATATRSLSGNDEWMSPVKGDCYEVEIIVPNPPPISHITISPGRMSASDFRHWIVEGLPSILENEELRVRKCQP